jgi:hypothetical protein
MPSTRQDESFASIISDQVDTVTISKSALDVAIDWIGSELEPEDIFTDKQLNAWAESNGYVKE